MKVDKGTSIVQARLSEEVKPYLLGMKSHFTQYQEGEAMKTIDGTYSYKLFQLLSCKSMGGTRTEWLVTLDEFRFLMGIADGQYKQMVHLTTRVITPAVKGNTETFPGLKVEKIKKGRSVVSLKFTWNAVTNPKEAKAKAKEDARLALCHAVYAKVLARRKEKNRMQEPGLSSQKLGHWVSKLIHLGIGEEMVVRILSLPNQVLSRLPEACDNLGKAKSNAPVIVSRLKGLFPIYERELSAD